MKRYDQNAFTVFVLLMGLCALFSCRTTRHTATVASIETRDTVTTHVADDSVAAGVSTHARHSDSMEQRRHDTGSLKIERDTAGRPVLLVWDLFTSMQHSAGGQIDFDGSFVGYHYSAAEDSKTTEASDVKKEEEKATKVGAQLPDLLGWALLAFTLLHLFYAISRELWRSRKE